MPIKNKNKKLESVQDIVIVVLLRDLLLMFLSWIISCDVITKWIFGKTQIVLQETTGPEKMATCVVKEKGLKDYDRKYKAKGKHHENKIEALESKNTEDSVIFKGGRM